MPRFDGTGPMGYGPLTGRGFGPCGRGPGFRRGYGRGFGRGFGFRYWQTAPAEPVALAKEEERKILEAELKDIEAEKQEIEKRLRELR